MTAPLIVFNVAALSPEYLTNTARLPTFDRLIKSGTLSRMTPVFPALTLPAQSSLATGRYPCDHGIVANGFFCRDRLETSFWDQYRSLVNGTPFWERLKQRRPDITTAVLFWQNTLYGRADIIITPKPIHGHHGLIPWCYSKPVGLYEAIAEDIGPFDLFHYWGPFASPTSSRWIVDAAISVMRRHQPDVMTIYLPLLDYASQRHGPDDPSVLADLEIIDGLIGRFMDALESEKANERATVAVFSEYSLSAVSMDVALNKILREHGFLAVREIDRKEYLDVEMSGAFAMVDHQVAHIYCREKAVGPVKALLCATQGVDTVLDRASQAQFHIDHHRSGELVALADADRWFSYSWWTDPGKSPDFAGTVDIHRKPGYDPLELFLEPESMVISQDTSLISGSHGLAGREHDPAAVFLLSGEGAERVELEPVVSMVDVAPLLEKIFLSSTSAAP